MPVRLTGTGLFEEVFGYFFPPGTLKGVAALANSLATLAAPAGPENGPTPLPESRTMVVFWWRSSKGKSQDADVELGEIFVSSESGF